MRWNAMTTILEPKSRAYIPDAAAARPPAALMTFLMFTDIVIPRRSLGTKAA
jgi:hypothetical protein